jgi:Rieske Fe-S protein
LPNYGAGKQELVVFRDKKGRVGALEPHCSHRGTSLEWGRVEEEGLRSCYHGWLYDTQGKPTRSQPSWKWAVAAGSPTGLWRMSGHPAVQQALRNHYFDSLGLLRLHVSVQA